MKVAIVGAGIAGLAAARRLYAEYAVTVYEAARRPGGHSRTVTLTIGARHVPVDTGFIVYNEVNYPRLTRLFADLKVPTRPANMSFGVSAEGGRIEWSSRSLSGLFADPRHLTHPPFLGMLADIRRFNRKARRDLHTGALRGHTMGSYLASQRLGNRFREHYLVPMAAAIWCLPDDDILRVPADSFLNFFDTHGLLGPRRKQWRTVAGGSTVYVERMAAPLRQRLRLGCAADQIRRSSAGVTIIDNRGSGETYDQAILACHADTALSLLADADEAERRVLGALRYTANRIVLHGDAALMPRRRRAWSSWNVIIPPVSEPHARRNGRFGATYWMNLLQRIDGGPPLFVSVNPPVPPRPDLVFDVFRMDHPRFDESAVAARNSLPLIQGRRRLWFCGAYAGSGFHEAGLLSGEQAAEGVRTAVSRPSFHQAAE